MYVILVLQTVVDIFAGEVFRADIGHVPYTADTGARTSRRSVKPAL